MIRMLFAFSFCLLTTLPTISQGQFVDKTLEYNIQHTYGIGVAGGGISFADFNADGLDDLTLASARNQAIFFFVNTGTGLSRTNLLPELKEEVKHILWVDFDNDGDKDLFITLADNYNRLYVNDGQLGLTDQTLGLGFPQNEYTSFGACWGDVNRDGWLDVYFGLRRIEKDGLSNISKLYLSTGRAFQDATLISGAEDGGKTPFCSSFIDYNNDKWPDIYTAHDRKRGNTMLKNNKNGTFTDVSLLTGTDLKMDGMSVSTGDCNNDGFFDIYVSNSEAGNALFVNQGGQSFINDAADKGVAFNSVAWGTNFLDGDNDGDQDLYVSGMLSGAAQINSTYYINQFPLPMYIPDFKIISDTASSFNNAYGDLNDDGYPDLGVINLGLYPSFIFENKGGNNHFVKIKLQGKLSNREGLGSLISIYTGSKKQIRYTQCGVGFMGQNSSTEIIGLGNNQVIDSLTVLWPTGHQDKLYGLTSDKRYVIEEGSTTNNVITIDNDVNLLILENTKEEDKRAESGLSISPNPIVTNGKAEILNKYKSCLKSVTIYSIQGIEVHTTKCVDGQPTFINTGELHTGSYVASIIHCDNKKETLRFSVIK
ncbi:MAG: CRTAC1 family protein [Saprospiraceae bacterium]|nr:CRTAC1 family protein [Saprospiraceae bacterium]